MGGCQSRSSVASSIAGNLCPSNGTKRRLAVASFKPGKKQSGSTNNLKPSVQIIPDLSAESKLLTPRTGSRNLPNVSISPSPTEAVTEDESSPSSQQTLASMYLASPLQTVIPEEEENPDIPSDEEDSIYITNDVPIDETAAGSLRKTLLRSNTSAQRPLLHIDEPPPLHPKSNDSVSEGAFSHFQKLKLQVKMINKSNEKQRRQNKMEERIQDVQAYHQLWVDFVDIQNEVSSIDSGQNFHTLPLDVRSFDLKDSDSWYFDFNTEEFAEDQLAEVSEADDGSQCSQANLSLLSEQSLEAQRRYYAEKRRFNNKSRNKSSSSYKGGKSMRSSGGSVSSSGSKDYGPSRPIFQMAPPRDAINLSDMEVMIQDSKSPGLARGDDNVSCVSELGEESTLGSNPASSHDYGVPRRRQRRFPASIPPPTKSLRSKLDLLENAVAELMINQGATKKKDDKCKETTGFGKLETHSEQMRILRVVSSSFDPTKLAEPDLQHGSLTESDGLLEHGKTRGTSQREDSLKDVDKECRDVLNGPYHKSKLKIGQPEQHEFTEQLQSVQETSYNTGDESSVNSDFADLRGSGICGNLLGNQDGLDDSVDVDLPGTALGNPPLLEFAAVRSSVSASRHDSQVGEATKESYFCHSTPPKNCVDQVCVESEGTKVYCPEVLQEKMKASDHRTPVTKKVHRGVAKTSSQHIVRLDQGEEELSSPFEACSQASRLLQKSRYSVSSLSTEQFRSLSSSPFAAWRPYRAQDYQPSDEEDSVGILVDVAQAPPSNLAKAYSLDENIANDSASVSDGFLDKSSGIDSSKGCLDDAFEDLKLVDAVENQTARVLLNLRHTNEKA